MIRPCDILYYYRNRYEKSKHVPNADKYIAELEAYIPQEIIDDYIYENSFKEVLSLCLDTFRPDQFDSYFGGLLRVLDQDFMDWLLSHQNELKRRLTWKHITQLHCNWLPWLGDMTIREVWEINLK